MYTVGCLAVLHLEVKFIGIPRGCFLLENLQIEGTFINSLGQDNHTKNRTDFLTIEMKE
jgi:hypothetical protein